MPKLLIVDDDVYIRLGIQQLIDWGELGVEIVDEAAGGREAFEIFLEKRPQLVLTDIRMPDGDGLELIQNIRKQGWNTRIIVLSGYDDFDYVREAMRYQVEDYLLKPVDADELKEIVKSCCEELADDSMNEKLRRESLQLLRNNVLTRWAENRIEYDQLREKMDFLGIPFDNFHNVQAAVITWKSADERSLSADESHYRSFAILNSMEEAMEKEKKGIAFMNTRQQIVCIFLGHHMQRKQFAKENLTWLQKTSENIAAVLKTPCYGTLGKPVNHSQLLHDSYQDALQLQDLIHLKGTVKCVDRDLIMGNLKRPIPEIANRSEMIPMLLTGQSEVWQESLHADFKWAISQHDPIAAAKYAAAEWLSIMKEIERQLAVNIIEEETVADLFEQTNVSAIQENIRSLLVKLDKVIHQRIIRDKSPIVEQVEHYVQTAYSEDLSLKSLAEQFNVNSVYLGRLFKTETGDYFSDYLNKRRLDEAKRLLKDTHLKASEISRRVGFQDPNYFFRKFKQSVGLSPTEFRNLTSSSHSYNEHV